MSAHRRLVPALAAAAICITGLSGCTTTSYSCSNDECTVKLKGGGAETDLYDGRAVISLDGADGETADLTVNDESMTCTEGDSSDVGGVSVTCDSVGDDEVELTVVG